MKTLTKKYWQRAVTSSDRAGRKFHTTNYTTANTPKIIIAAIKTPFTAPIALPDSIL
jgi:hypothetical protein